MYVYIYIYISAASARTLILKVLARHTTLQSGMAQELEGSRTIMDGSIMAQEQ